MKYSYILAGLAASAIATPLVDIIVGEDMATASSRRNHRHHDHRGWLSSLLGGSRSRSDRHHHGKHRNQHNDRRHHNDRHHHNDHRGHLHRALGLGDGDDDGSPMLGDHYEQGGELYESRGHCIFRDSMGDPHEEWQACGMMARGTDFAACYQREEREIEDELAGRGWHNDEDKDHKRRSGHGRHGSHGRHGRNHHGDRMNVLASGNDDDDDNGGDNHRGHHGKHGNHGRRDHKKEIYECRIDLDDENRRQELLEQCCEQQVRGDLDPESQTCWNVRRRDTMEFENCAMAQGAQNAECYKPDDNDGGHDGGDDGDHDGNDGRF
ncbi:hypothetical protein Vi05172_g105 [Venturia inaequalis]|nr:hypothetical protein Vi05172_g105 [Venturia inaequalis]